MNFTVLCSAVQTQCLWKHWNSPVELSKPNMAWLYWSGCKLLSAIELSLETWKPARFLTTQLHSVHLASNTHNTKRKNVENPTLFLFVCKLWKEKICDDLKVKNVFVWLEHVRDINFITNCMKKAFASIAHVRCVCVFWSNLNELENVLSVICLTDCRLH